MAKPATTTLRSTSVTNAPGRTTTEGRVAAPAAGLSPSVSSITTQASPASATLPESSVRATGGISPRVPLATSRSKRRKSCGSALAPKLAISSATCSPPASGSARYTLPRLPCPTYARIRNRSAKVLPGASRGTTEVTRASYHEQRSGEAQEACLQRRRESRSNDRKRMDQSVAIFTPGPMSGPRGPGGAAAQPQLIAPSSTRTFEQPTKRPIASTGYMKPVRLPVFLSVPPNFCISGMPISCAMLTSSRLCSMPSNCR